MEDTQLYTDALTSINNILAVLSELDGRTRRLETHKQVLATSTVADSINKLHKDLTSIVVSCDESRLLTVLQGIDTTLSLLHNRLSRLESKT